MTFLFPCLQNMECIENKIDKKPWTPEAPWRHIRTYIFIINLWRRNIRVWCTSQRCIQQSKHFNVGNSTKDARKKTKRSIRMPSLALLLSMLIVKYVAIGCCCMLVRVYMEGWLCRSYVCSFAMWHWTMLLRVWLVRLFRRRPWIRLSNGDFCWFQGQINDCFRWFQREY